VTKDEKLYLEVILMPEDGVRSKGYHLIVEHLSILATCITTESIWMT